MGRGNARNRGGIGLALLLLGCSSGSNPPLRRSSTPLYRRNRS